MAKLWDQLPLVDFWDQRVDAIRLLSSRLEGLSPAQEDLESAAVTEAVGGKARALTDKDLLQHAFVMTDDLYRAAAVAPSWGRALSLYLRASAATLLELVSERGYAVVYMADNTFALDNMQRPVELFGPWFGYAGITYICPQQLALRVIEEDSVPAAERLAQLDRYISEGRDIAAKLVAQCEAHHRHVFYLDTNSVEGSFEAPQRLADKPRVLSIFRTEPPISGSTVQIRWPELIAPS